LNVVHDCVGHFKSARIASDQLLGDSIGETAERPTHRYGAAGADGEVLRTATSLVAKQA
jgi:hypothetical protein